MRAIYLDDMTSDVVVVVDDDYTPLSFSQALVDGLIEFAPISAEQMDSDYKFNPIGIHRMLSLSENNELIVNEEGLSREDFAYNSHASRLSGLDLVGPAIIVRIGPDDLMNVHINDCATILDIFGAKEITMTVDEVCRKYIVPRGTWDFSEAWS